MVCIPQRALAAIGDDNNRFLLRRVHVWPNLFLLQQVRAPVLKNRPVFGDAAFQWDRVAIRAFETPSTWVDLGATFTALGVDYPRGECLENSPNVNIALCPPSVDACYWHSGEVQLTKGWRPFWLCKILLFCEASKGQRL